MTLIESQVPETQPKVLDPKALLGKWEGNFVACRNARVPFEKQWATNISFYFGKQYVRMVGSGGMFTLKEPAAPPWRVRLVVNKIRRYVRGELTKLTKEEIQFFVAPASTEETDLAAAKAADAIAEFQLHELGFNRIRRRSTFWMLLCGSSFFKIYWDDNELDPSGEPGAVILDPITPLNIYVPDLLEEELEAQSYVIHTAAKDRDWVVGTFGVEVDADVEVSAGAQESRIQTAMGVTPVSGAKFVLVKEAWIKPCREHPNGAVLTWANNQVLNLTEEWPYSHKQFPFAKIDHIPTGRFYGDSTIVDLIPLQREYNRTRSQLIEAKNRTAKPQMVAPKGSLDTSKVTSEPGLIIQYQPGFAPPQVLSPADIPQYVMEELTRDVTDMDDIAAQYETTKGRTPPGVEAASAIAYLQEENDSLFHPSVASIEEATERIGRQLLSLVADFWDVARTIKVVGENGVYEAMQFSKHSIQGNIDLRVEAGSSAPRSRAAKQAFITELGKLGWLPPDKVLRYLDLVETNKLYEELQVSPKQAQREHARMQELMTPLPVNDYDDDQVHIDEHSNYMRGQEYENLDPQIQQLFVAHLTLHKNKIMMQQMQGQVPGQPGMPGQPPEMPTQAQPGVPQ